jgi:hypothetical protein
VHEPKNLTGVLQGFTGSCALPASPSGRR